MQKAITQAGKHLLRMLLLRQPIGTQNGRKPENFQKAAFLSLAELSLSPLSLLISKGSDHSMQLLKFTVEERSYYWAMSQAFTVKKSQ